jgi:hypothetical protein
MSNTTLRALGLALVATIAVACGSAAPAGSPSAPASAPPATFAEYDASFCGAFTSLIRAVGNPDAGTPSVLSKKLDDAVRAGDALAGDQAAAAMTAELETGRRHAAAAARWQPAAAAMAQMDRLLVAFEAMTMAKRAVAAKVPGAPDPQQAFEQAGGVQAWSGMLSGVSTLPIPSGTVPAPCRALSGTL